MVKIMIEKKIIKIEKTMLGIQMIIPPCNPHMNRLHNGNLMLHLRTPVITSPLLLLLLILIIIKRLLLYYGDYLQKLSYLFDRKLYFL